MRAYNAVNRGTEISADSFGVDHPTPTSMPLPAITESATSDCHKTVGQQSMTINRKSQQLTVTAH